VVQEEPVVAVARLDRPEGLDGGCFDDAHAVTLTTRPSEILSTIT
jgi:hypothetical protein